MMIRISIWQPPVEPKSVPALSNRMAWFKAFRNEYDYTAYGDNRSAVTIDIKLVVVIYASIIVSVATLIATIGIRGKERWWTFLRVLYSLFIGTSILVSIFGHGWQTGSTRTQSYYTFISGQKFDGQVGLMMGLSSVNITLSGHVGRHRSQVDYNERMGWFDVGQVQSEYRGCLEKGLPEPILSVAAYFSYDAGGLRFGRSYQNAGYFAYVLLWSSFSFWLITNVVINSVVFYGSVMFLLSGVCMVLAVIVYHVCQPLYSLRIPFENNELTIHYDWSFWLMLASGCMTTVLGLLLILLDWKVPKMLSLFFLLDTTFDQDEDETNHNLARSPNENKTTPTKRSYLSLVDFEVSKKVKGSSARVDRQTSTLQGEINHAYRSEQDFRSFGLNTQLSKSDSCIPTLDNSEVGSQIRLVKRDESESVYTVSDSASHSSIESLPFEMQTIPQIVVDIPEDEASKTTSPTVEKDTHL